MPEKEVISLEDKINELNEYCEHSLSITHYTTGWEVGSYGRDTLLESDGELYQKFGHPAGKSLEEAVNKAYNFMMANIDKLILKREGDRWRNVEDGHINYGLENALREIFEETNHRLFRIGDNEVYLIEERDEI